MLLPSVVLNDTPSRRPPCRAGRDNAGGRGEEEEDTSTDAVCAAPTVRLAARMISAQQKTRGEREREREREWLGIARGPLRAH